MIPVFSSEVRPIKAMRSALITTNRAAREHTAERKRVPRAAVSTRRQRHSRISPILLNHPIDGRTVNYPPRGNRVGLACGWCAPASLNAGNAAGRRYGDVRREREDGNFAQHTMELLDGESTVFQSLEIGSTHHLDCNCKASCRGYAESLSSFHLATIQVNRD